jgi:hypothetical protein
MRLFMVIGARRMGALPVCDHAMSPEPGRPPAPGHVLRSGVAVLGMTPETKDEPGTQNDAAKKEERAKEPTKNQSEGDRR